MRAMVYEVAWRPLKLRDLPVPQPQNGQVLIRVEACGVCRTDLHIVDGDLTAPKLPLVPGHEIVGHVVECGPGCDRFPAGTRVGIGWIHSSDGSDLENLSPEFRATGRDANGGYAEYVAVPETYAYPIPDLYSDVEAAPLLCAGGVGYRALMLTKLQDGQALGLTGFGGSGHLVLQLSKHLFPRSPVYVFARSARERDFSLALGADWAGETQAQPPTPPMAVIDTTPAWKPVLAALECLAPGGRLVINAIRKEAGDQHLLAGLRYEDHLWMEKEIKSVANVTHADIAAFLPIAAAVPLQVRTRTYPLAAANEALLELRNGHVEGAKVLDIKQ